jgi:hypothetical protein
MMPRGEELLLGPVVQGERIQFTQTEATKPSMVRTLWQYEALPYALQSLVVLQAVKHVLVPPLFVTHHMTLGLLGQAAFDVHDSVHHPVPEPPFSHTPEVQPPGLVHGSPSGIGVAHAVLQCVSRHPLVPAN